MPTEQIISDFGISLSKKVWRYTRICKEKNLRLLVERLLVPVLVAGGSISVIIVVSASPELILGGPGRTPQVGVTRSLFQFVYPRTLDHGLLFAGVRESAPTPRLGRVGAVEVSL